MVKTELQEWFDRVWFSYPKDLTHNKKGAKPPAMKAAEKIYKSGGIEELNRITGNIEALMRYDRAELKSGGKPDRWPHFSTFLNNGYYDREIESYTELKKNQEKCKCGNPVDIQELCLKCFETQPHDWKREMYDRLKAMGLAKRKDETKSEYAKRCRSVFMKGGYGGLVGK